MAAIFDLDAQPLPGAVQAVQVHVAAERLHGVVSRALADGARLIALWGCDDTDVGAGFVLRVAVLTRSGLCCLRVPLPADHPHYASIADLYPAALRMQRATYDLLGIHAQEAGDSRKWLRHGAWPGGTFPLRRSVGMDAAFDAVEDRYPFVRVEGDGVHEIPVGPVHAGTIEPGHFRFSIVGEAVLRLEQRLG